MADLLVREAAALLGISRQAVYELWRRGRLRVVAERPLRFSGLEILAYKAERETRHGIKNSSVV